jgi:hypothetical protein
MVTCYSLQVRIREIISDFDRYLGACGHSFEGLVVGRTALELLGIQTPARPDLEPNVEVVYPELPEIVLEASEDFAMARALAPDWLRACSATDLVTRLPKGWTRRMRLTTFAGRSIFLHSLARPDLIAGRLLAFLEGRAALDDCLVLGILPGDLQRSREYLLEQRCELSWEEHVERCLRRVEHALFESQPERYGAIRNPASLAWAQQRSLMRPR